jgi:hypothetical protein
MRNLDNAFSSFAATGTMWAVDRETGSLHTLPMLQFLLIDGTPEASIYEFKPSAAAAYVVQARLLAEIQGRN